MLGEITSDLKNSATIMNGLLELKHINNIFIAKGNVKHTTGGPNMALVGFIHPIAETIFQELDENLTAYQQSHLSEKILIDKEKGIGFYPNVSSDTFYGHIFNQNGKLNGWYNPNTYAGKFRCLVRFYDELQKRFVYKIFSPLELELT